MDLCPFAISAATASVDFRSMERNKELSQDESRSAQNQLQEITNAFSSQMQEIKQEKEAEVMEV